MSKLHEMYCICKPKISRESPPGVSIMSGRKMVSRHFLNQYNVSFFIRRHVRLSVCYTHTHTHTHAHTHVRWS